MFVGTFRSRAVRRLTVPLFAWGCLALGVAYCYILTEDIQVWGDYAINHFVSKLASLSEDNALRRQAELFIRHEVATEAMYSTLLWSINHWMALALLGFNRHNLAAFVGIYVSLVITMVVDSQDWFASCSSSLFIATVASVMFPTCGILFERLRRTNFLNEMLLTREMQAAQMADSMLNHTLKALGAAAKAAYVQQCGGVSDPSASWETQPLMETTSVSTGVSPAHCALESRSVPCLNAPDTSPASNAGSPKPHWSQGT